MDFGLVNRKNSRSVALKAVDIKGDLVAEALTVRIGQKYCNDSGANAEFIYTFPLPERAAVSDFTAKIGGRVIRGEVQEKEKAFATYDQAIKDGDSAFLLENVRPNVFQVSLGQVDADEEVEISIGYFQEIPTSDAEMRLSIPMLLAPRYIPGKPAGRQQGPGRSGPTDRVPDADFITPPQGDVDYRATVNLRLNTLSHITTVESPSHDIKTEPINETTALVSLSKLTTRMNRDFVLTIKLTAEITPHLVYAKDPRDGYYAYVSYAPELLAVEKNQPHEYLFLIDVSGSMAGSKLKQAAQALQICLRNLYKDDYFNMIAFESDAHPFASESVPFNQRNLTRATKWVQGLRPLGGTEILPAIQLALQKETLRERIMFLFTDGQVGNEKEILDYIKRHQANLCLYSVGIDSAVNDHFINQVAAVGSGFAEFVYPGENLEDKVIRHFSRIHACFMEKVSLELPGFSANNLADAIPSRLYDLEPVTHVFKTRTPVKGPLIIKGHVESGEVRIEVNDIKQIDDVEALKKLWAKRRIASLEAYLKNGNPRRSKSIRAEIIAISEKHRLVSSLTTFVAVYERENKLSGLPETVVIPVEFPHGWEMFDSYTSQISHMAHNFVSPLVGGAVTESSMLSSPRNEIRFKLSSGSSFNVNRQLSPMRSFVEPQPSQRDDISRKLKDLVASQNSDGSFGAADVRTKIKETTMAIIYITSHATNISIYRNQLQKAIRYLMSEEQRIQADKELIESVNQALQAALARKVIRRDNQEQSDFALRIQAGYAGV